MLGFTGAKNVRCYFIIAETSCQSHRIILRFASVRRHHAAFCAPLAAGHDTLVTALAALSECLALVHACLAILWLRLAFAHACLAVLLLRFAFAHAVLQRYCRVLRSLTPVFFPLQEKRNGLRYAPFLFREVGIAVCKFSCLLRVIGLFSVHFGLARFFMAIPTGYERARSYGVGGAAECVFAQSHWLCNDTAGSTLGLRVPNLRQRVFDSLDSLHAAAGFAG